MARPSNRRLRKAAKGSTRLAGDVLLDPTVAVARLRGSMTELRHERGGVMRLGHARTADTMTRIHRRVSAASSSAAEKSGRPRRRA